MTKLIASDADLSPRLRLDLVLSAKQLAPHDESSIRAALLSSEPLVRRAAVQWAGEQRLTGARDAVQASLSRLPMTTDLFLATIAGLEMIDGQNPQEFDKTPASKYVIPLASNPETPPAVLAAALRIADPNDPAITVDLLTRLAESDNTTVQVEAARTLAFSNDPRAVDELMKLAVNPSLRADALLGLSRWLHQTTPADAKIRSFFFDHDPWTVDTLRAARGLVATDSELQKALLARLPTAAANSDPSELIAQAQLALGDISLPPNLVGQLKPRPHDVATWQQELSNAHTGNADAGRIVFFHPQGPGCSRCHTVEGRGGKVGPDLSQIGRTMSHERLVESILDPGREVAPQFTNWQMVTADGRVHTGMIVHENEGLTVLGDQEGKTDELKTIDIIERRPQRISVMPEKLVDRMTVQEFRDLMAFLKSPGK
jgi:putative heme-binding domain-containing protein